MVRNSLEKMGISVRRKRGDRGKREVAREIQISPATLMRIEEGRFPDLETFAKVCRWLEADPAEFLGLQVGVRPKQPFTAHFKVDKALNAKTAEALAAMVVLAAQQQEDPAEPPPDVDT